MEKKTEQEYTKMQKGNSEFQYSDIMVGQISIETWLYSEKNHECFITISSLLDNPNASAWGQTVFKGSLQELIQIITDHNNHVISV